MNQPPNNPIVTASARLMAADHRLWAMNRNDLTLEICNHMIAANQAIASGDAVKANEALTEVETFLNGTSNPTPPPATAPTGTPAPVPAHPTTPQPPASPATPPAPASGEPTNADILAAVSGLRPRVDNLEGRVTALETRTGITNKKWYQRLIAPRS